MGSPDEIETAEERRLAEDARRTHNWKRWGPYLSERQWGTVREDYSANGDAWDYFPFAQSMSRAYRWGEDGLLGITDRECRLCFAIALWNGQDPILKERLFGLTNPQGNHGEDVKEEYFYLDSTPTHSWLRALYKYPQAAFPYERLIAENARRDRHQREFELVDTGAFANNRYFDVVAEYAKNSPDDLLVRITVHNRGPEPAPLHLLPTLWFRNTWVWGCKHEGCWVKPHARRRDAGTITTDHESLGRFVWAIEPVAGAEPPELLFTDNETNSEKLFGTPNVNPYVKDAFNEYVIRGRREAVNPRGLGTKAAALYRLTVPAGGSISVRLRLFPETEALSAPFGSEFDETFARRLAEADAYYDRVVPPTLSPDERRVARQAYSGLLWTKQYYQLIVREWLTGDPDQPPPPPGHSTVRDADWPHLYSRDVLSMPDNWEYPWFAAWDLAFHMIPLARIDAASAKAQLLLLLREWYMHPNGQLPAYEWNFDDVNPPVHAWAAWRVYKLTAPAGQRDRRFLARVFQKLLLNFTWWVNRKDPEGNNVFAGGFLGLDNIGLFDRSQPLPTGGTLGQADGTAWMAFYCTTMLAIALELASEDPTYEDLASKFFEHFVAIADAMNELGGTGLWDETDGFYYDVLQLDGQRLPLRLRSMVGVIPLFAVEVLDERLLKKLPGFGKRLNWFLKYRSDLSQHLSYVVCPAEPDNPRRLLALPSRERLERVLRRVLDEGEFLSPYGVRSLSKAYAVQPYEFDFGGREYRVAYEPGESQSGLFGGNSNWRGPVWFPVNYLLIEALERYHYFYGDSFRIECPTDSGQLMTLAEVAAEISRRLTALFLRPEGGGPPPFAGGDRRFADDPHWRDFALFNEYFDGDTGRGLGASHQTGWTALAARLLDAQGRRVVVSGSK